MEQHAARAMVFNGLYGEDQHWRKKLEAILEVEGVGAGYGWGMYEKLGRLYIVDKTKCKSKWDTYPQNEEDEKLVAFDQLPPIFRSEMLAAIESIKQVEVKVQ